MKLASRRTGEPENEIIELSFAGSPVRRFAGCTISPLARSPETDVRRQFPGDGILDDVSGGRWPSTPVSPDVAGAGRHRDAKRCDDREQPDNRRPLANRTSRGVRQAHWRVEVRTARVTESRGRGDVMAAAIAGAPNRFGNRGRGSGHFRSAPSAELLKFCSGRPARRTHGHRLPPRWAVDVAQACDEPDAQPIDRQQSERRAASGGPYPTCQVFEETPRG
jgi:hypothetical protein